MDEIYTGNFSQENVTVYLFFINQSLLLEIIDNILR